MKSPYKLSLDLRVLDHLGIKLYSNAAAVLSEAVANAWDADADLVELAISDSQIVITDDGIGMNQRQINERFLTVGYDKLNTEGDTSDKGRPFMGRKGIGKLALFSIADEIEVHTRKGTERHAFRMNTDDVKAAVEKGNDYFPKPIAFAGPRRGTRIVLNVLKKKRTTSSVAALRKRIARRFSVIGHEATDGSTFVVTINGEAVGNDDREDLKAIEFLWEFGEKRIEKVACPSLKHRFKVSNVVNEEHPGWKVSGWIGAAEEPKKLKHDEAGSMHGIVVLARGRLIQENILDKLNYSRILGSYVTGQVEADFLASKEDDDIATSDRQRLVEDDERYVALTTFLRQTLLKIQDNWTDLRNEARGKQAVTEVPQLAAWIESLPESQQKNAERLLGLIRGVEVDTEEERRTLYRSGMLGFERLRLREEAHKLAEATELTAANLLPLLSDLSALEGTLYLEIVRARMDVIREFKNLIDANEKEKVLQKHLFNHLWLLDTGWDRASGSPRIEEKLKKEFGAFSENLSDKQSKGRLDIRYRTNGGEHIVVELKRVKRQMAVAELIEQGSKYRTALKKCLKTASKIDNALVSVVFVLGRPVAEEAEEGGKEEVRRLLEAINARVVYYDSLIENASAQYQEYVDRNKKLDHLTKVLNALADS